MIESNYELFEQWMASKTPWMIERESDENLISLFQCTWFDRYEHGSPVFRRYVETHKMVEAEMVRRYAKMFNVTVPDYASRNFSLMRNEFIDKLGGFE